MAVVDIESVIKKGVEEALNKPILNGKSVMEWAEIGIRSQEQKHGHWISVKDRLPDKQPCEYLVVNANNVETAICLDNMWITPRRVIKITHWMPLPEPPKEVKQDG